MSDFAPQPTSDAEHRHEPLLAEKRLGRGPSYRMPNGQRATQVDEIFRNIIEIRRPDMKLYRDEQRRLIEHLTISATDYSFAILLSVIDEWVYIPR